MIHIRPELVDCTVGQLVRCGAGTGECVVYWLAWRDKPGHVVDIIHPRHTASSNGYAIDDRWLTDFSFDLGDSGRTVVAQVHTHPGDHVNHSDVDDEFVLVPSPGFVSIVVPDFAAHFKRSRCAVHVLGGTGKWRLDSKAVSW